MGGTHVGQKDASLSTVFHFGPGCGRLNPSGFRRVFGSPAGNRQRHADLPAAHRAVWEDAKLNGVDFRAVGNEPGWYLEIYDKGTPAKIDFISDYDQVYYTFPTAQRNTQSSPPRTRYVARVGGHQLEVLLEPGPSRDSMSGEAFETIVALKLNNRTYQGCGKPLH